MSDKEKQELQNKIIKNLESDIKKVENTLGVMKEKLQYLKDIVWDRQSEMEREQMLKVLNGEKESTEVKSNIGSILVDSELTEKLEKKHLDNPNLRGMVTSEEFLSFPKVAKNVEAEYNPLHKDYTWKVKANDESILRYGSREYEINGENVNRLLTNYSETKKGQRIINQTGVGEQGQPHHLIKDLNFLRPAENIIPQNQNQSQESLGKNPSDSKQEKMNALREQVNNIAKNKTNSPKDLSPKIDKER